MFKYMKYVAHLIITIILLSVGSMLFNADSDAAFYASLVVIAATMFYVASIGRDLVKEVQQDIDKHIK